MKPLIPGQPTSPRRINFPLFLSAQRGVELSIVDAFYSIHDPLKDFIAGLFVIVNAVLP